jgi:hypothetical protein
MNEKQICSGIREVGREGEVGKESGGLSPEWKERREAEEIWKDVVGYEGLYQVSSLGKVRTIEGVILKQWIKDGYHVVSLKTTTRKCLFVHRLMALAFLSKKEKDREVDHINRDRSDNRLNNLRWVSRAENIVNQNKFAVYKRESGRFQSRISVNGKKKTLGTFDTYEEALVKRIEAEELYYPNIKQIRIL